MTQPTNSRDSEPEDLIDKPNGIRDRLNQMGHFDEKYNGILLALEEELKASYVSRKEVEEAIDNLPSDNTDCGVDYLGNSDGCSEKDHHYRSGRFDMHRETEEYLRAKLLPPTKGHDDE